MCKLCRYSTPFAKLSKCSWTKVVFSVSLVFIASQIQAANCIDVFSQATQESGPELILPTFQSTNSNNKLDSNNISAAAGEYEEIKVTSNGTLTFTSSDSTYTIDKLIIEERATVYMPPGDYWISELVIKRSADIIVQGSGTVRIYVDKANIERNVDFAKNNTYVIIVVYDEFKTERNFEFDGVLYSTSTVEIDRNSTINGAIHADDIDLGSGVDVNYDDDFVNNADFNGMCDGLITGPPTAVASYEMEEASWGAVIDSIGGYNGVAYNGANTIGSSCRYGQFDGVNDYVEIPHNAALNGTDALTYVAYIRPDSWTGVDQIIAKSVHGGGSGRAQMGLFSEGGVFKGRAETAGGRYEITASLPAIAGDWVQVALVFDGTSLTLYQDAVAVATTNFGNTTLNQTTDPLTISKRVGTDTYYFHGLIDEVRVYTDALSAQEILDLYNTVTPCPLTPSLHHVEISTDGTALTCTSESVTVRACANADCSSVANQGVDITLSVTGGNASWNSNPITIPANSNAGVTATLTDRIAETVTIGASSSPAATDATTCSNTSCNVIFSEAGYILSLANHNSCTAEPLMIQAVRLSDNGVSCAPAYTGNQTVNFAFDYSNPSSGSTIPTLANTAMAAATVNQNRTVFFDTNASASLDFSYQDAGQLTLTISDAGSNGLSSSSVNTVATPAKLIVSTAAANASCTGPDFGNCTEFRTAGVPGNTASEFPLSISAACADDTVTPNFQMNNIALSANLVAPITGTNTNLGTTSVDITSNGTATVTQTVTEVGAFSITATPGTYLGQTLAMATSNTLGRFTPDRLLVTDNNPMLTDATCNFSYQGQDIEFAPGLEPELTVTAVNSAGTTTRNYGGDGIANHDFWHLNPALLADRTYNNQVAAYSGTLSTTLGLTTTAGHTDYDGSNTFSFGNDLVNYNKTSVTPIVSDDAPFNANVTLDLSSASLTDTDGVFLDSNNDNIADNFQSNTIAGTNLRWGRWQVDNGFGSELQVMNIMAIAQYYNGSQFITSSSDSCTPTTTLGLSNYSGNLSAGETSASQTAISSGIIPISFTAPGAGNDGSLLITLTTPSWLQYDYDANGSLENASATVTFGIYQGKQPLIIKRQTY